MPLRSPGASAPSALLAALTSLALAAPPSVGAAEVPAVAAGPALYEQAAAVDTPIEAVVVYSDRARITRQGRADVAAGVRAVRLTDLPGTTLLDTLRVGAKGATVLRVEAAPVERIRAGVEQVEALVVAIEDLRAKLERLEARRGVLSAELGLLAGIAPAELPAAEPRPAPPTVSDGFARARAFIADRRAATADAIEAINADIRALIRTLDEKKRELARFDGDAFTPVQRVEVLAVLQVEQARPVVTVDYFVQGASWKPAYAVELVDDGRAVTLRTAGRVSQTTGEDWTDVALSLSTAVPGQGIAAPRLDTWTLGESRDFTPTPRAQRDPAGTPLPAPITGETPGDVLRRVRLEALQTRVADARSYDAPEADGAVAYGGAGMGVGSMGAMGAGRAAPQVQVRAHSIRVGAAPPMPSADMGWAADEVEGEMARPESVALRTGSAPGGPAMRRTPLDLFEQTADTRPRFADPTLPAVLAGGLDYVWRAATRATVPSNPEVHTVPLSAERHPVQTRYEVAPALRPTAYLAATVRNTRDTPILAGPVDIFVGADYVGTGALETTGPGGELALPLGADEDIRVERRLIPRTRTEGVFGKEDLTVYTTEIDVANDKRRPISIRVVEQFPLDGVTDDVEVKRGGTDPKPVEIDEAGRMVFALDIPPGQVRTVRFDYTVRRPADWQLFQQ